MAEQPLPVLMYHGLHAHAQQRGVFDPVYSVTPEAFAAQLDWLVANGFRSARLGDATAASVSPRVLITFDDGDASNLEVALPLLAARRMTAEFFISSALIGQPGRPDAADLRALCAAGMGVQSHGVTHRYLDDLDAAELERELRDSKQCLERITGEPVRALALPGGRGGERERRAALRLGYVELLNSAPGCNRHWQPGRYLQRLAITRDMQLTRFARLVQWHGLAPRWMRARYHALRTVKRVIGNRRYERVRERMLAP
jgi:peptidoglycan/xylan/chitin deacetylase (PgdA/CDA1 family)